MSVHVFYVPTVVPAECMVHVRPLAFSSFCTSATSLATETLPVPTYTRRHLFLIDVLFRAGKGAEGAWTNGYQTKVGICPLGRGDVLVIHPGELWLGYPDLALGIVQCLMMTLCGMKSQWVISYGVEGGFYAEKR